MGFEARIAAELQSRHRDALYRQRRIVESPQEPELLVEGQRFLSFCSNDYLGLASHPKIAEAFKQGLSHYGTGSGAAHLISGHSAAHEALEEELAAFVCRPAALLFSTGYMANVGVINALVSTGDHVIHDQLNHASLLDGGWLSRAESKRVAHADPEAFDAAMTSSGENLLVTDAVFSMDGDLAPLSELSDIARHRNAWLMADDAHGFGVLGPKGAGTVAEAGLSVDDVPVLIGTLGKAAGCFGAFVAGSSELIEYLIQRARTWIYTTAPPPALAEATRAALGLIAEDEWRRQKLSELVTMFRDGALALGLPLMDSQTAIQPLMIGDAARAMAIAKSLREQGVWITPIRPPTVPPGTARLRITLTAAHSRSQVDQLLSALEAANK